MHLPRCRAAHGAGVQVRLQADLVPRLRRLLGAVLVHQGVRQARSAAGERRGRIGHRLLLAHSRLHQLLRLSRRARALARGGDRAQARASRPHGGRGERRRRRLLHRRQSLSACLPAQRRPDLRRHGQPRVRHDQRPAFAHHRARLGLQALPRRHRPAHLQSAGDRARRGCQFRRARLRRRSRTAPRRSSPRRSARPDSPSSKSSARA